MDKKRAPSQGRVGPLPELVQLTKRLNSEYAEKGDIAGARRLIAEMRAKGITPSLVTANTLIKCYVRARQPEGAEGVLAELPAWGLRPDAATFSTLVDAYGQAGQVGDAFRILYNAEIEADRGGSTSDSRVYASLLRFVPPHEVATIMSRLSARGVAYDRRLCHGALSTLANAGLADEAERFVSRHMSRPDVQPDARTVALLLKAHCASEGGAVAAEAVLRRFADRSHPHGADQAGPPIDAPAVSIVMNALVSRDPPEVERATQLMEWAVGSPVSIVPDTAMFNVLIKGCSRCCPPRPELGQRLLVEIERAGLKLSAPSICSVLDAWCQMNHVAKAQELADAAMANGTLQPSPVVFNTLIKGYSQCRCKRTRGLCRCEPCGCCQPQQGIALLERMAQLGLRPDTVTINTLLDAHCSAGQLTQAWLLLDSLLLRRPPAEALEGGPGGAVAFEPDMSTFLTLFGAMLRAATHPTSSSARHSGESGCCTGAVEANPAKSRLLEQLSSGMQILRRLRSTLSPALLDTLQKLCSALHVSWSVSRGEADGRHHAAAVADALEPLLRAEMDRVQQEQELLPVDLVAEMSTKRSSKGDGLSAPCMTRLSSHRPVPEHTADVDAPPSLHCPYPATALESDQSELTLRIDQLFCQGCVGEVQRVLSVVPGVVSVEITLVEACNEGLATVRGRCSSQEVLKAVKGIGKGVELVTERSRAASGLNGTAESAMAKLAGHATASRASVTGGSGGAPLDSNERAELQHLRERVRELEAALNAVAGIVASATTQTAPPCAATVAASPVTMLPEMVAHAAPPPANAVQSGSLLAQTVTNATSNSPVIAPSAPASALPLTDGQAQMDFYSPMDVGRGPMLPLGGLAFF